MSRLVELLAGWPLGASIAAALTAQGFRPGRRRAALNEALHELRRPLQALALASGPGRAAPDGFESSLRLAADALARLEREINGGDPVRAREPVRLRPLLVSAVGRWRGRAALTGGALALRWRAGEAVVRGDPTALAQALDNLIVNAIEHGGPAIVVEALAREERLRIAIADSGSASRPTGRRETPVELLGRLAGGRRGHGLAVVRRTAAAHDGRFVLRRSPRGSVALLELPLVTGPEREAMS